MPLVRVGRIGRTHGVSGEVTLTQSPLSVAELTAVGSFVWRGPRGESIDLVLEGARPAHSRVLARFQGYAGRDEAAVLSNGELWVEAERLPDPGPGTVYAFQLVGLRVETEDGRHLGVLEDVLPLAAHPVYVVRGERELLVPATPEVLKRVELERGVITVALPRGLEDL